MLRWQHSTRFRKVANRYARRVFEAYDGDIAQAAADTDEQVAQRVADWERSQGLTVRDWYAWGQVQEGREQDER